MYLGCCCRRWFVVGVGVGVGVDGVVIDIGGLFLVLQLLLLQWSFGGVAVRVSKGC